MGSSFHEDYLTEVLQKQIAIERKVQTVESNTTLKPDYHEGAIVYITLVGNLEIQNPADDDQIVGATFTFVFVQDNSGSHTVTWDSDFEVWAEVTATADKLTSIQVTWLGGKWVQTS